MSIETNFTLPEPFAWIDIPAGQVTLADDKGTFDVPAFQIAKYPVTVAQYKLFIQDDGYQKRAYWTQSGWEYREKENITLPDSWNHASWQVLWKPALPIVNISWLEAYAFSRWLSEKTGLTISLPTEQQWQRAAQGNDGWVYPWGNAWDTTTRCNHSLADDWQERYDAGDITTPVTKYELVGASPFGVVDMAGNVWEWCLNDYETVSTDNLEDIDRGRSLRGGAWGVKDTNFFRTNFRHWFYPHYRFSNTGFRLALS